MDINSEISARSALEKLKQGNAEYLSAKSPIGDISPSTRQKTCAEGQKPYAVVITCSDSRVIPESIFSAGIGELFVIRVAGNVMDRTQLGSVIYAVSHLGCKFVVVLGHTHCGAVHAAIHDEPDGYVKYLTDEIRLAIRDEKDENKACRLNVERGVRVTKDALGVSEGDESSLSVIGAIYNIDSGKVDFLNEI